MGSRCHGHRNPVVPESHADIADNERSAMGVFLRGRGLGRHGCRCGICLDIEGISGA